MPATHLAIFPPVFIFARKRLPEKLLDGAPPDSIALCSDNGWANNEIFTKLMEHFIKHVRPTKQEPVLLILDNHESHKDFRGLQMAVDNGITILSLPPHSSHKLQPLDIISVFGPLSKYNECSLLSWKKCIHTEGCSNPTWLQFFLLHTCKRALQQTPSLDFKGQGFSQSIH